MPINLTSIGILVIVIGFVLVLIGALTNTQNKDTKIAVGGFIGFIPFGFANDKRLLWAVIGFMVIGLVFFLVSNFLLHGKFK